MESERREDAGRVCQDVRGRMGLGHPLGRPPLRQEGLAEQGEAGLAFRVSMWALDKERADGE